MKRIYGIVRLWKCFYYEGAAYCVIYTTFEQTDHGFVLLDINKKQSDKNRIRKNKIERFGPKRPLQCTGN